jgi:hypothetical protein
MLGAERFLVDRRCALVELHFAFLDVENRIRLLILRKDNLISLVG